MNASALISGVPADEQVSCLAERLAAVHGQVVLRNEASGLHAYMACPRCLEENGRRELKSKHMALNVDKYLNLGKHKLRFMKAGKSEKKGYACCMKEHGPTTLNELLAWPPLEERGIENFCPSLVIDGAANRYLVPDYNTGVMIPDHPGRTIPVTQLAQSHPASQYLAYRGYDPFLLHAQFRAAFCDRESPEGEEYGGRWYRRHSEGWKSTPQGRIIFYSVIEGSEVCWQGRYLEMPINGVPHVWHPYREQWEPRPPWGKGEEPVKYNTATGAFRNNQLCGYDVAVGAVKRLGDEYPTCVLAEGPMDAGRFPERGMAVLGKYLSEAQSHLVAVRFRRAVLAFDADQAGKEACDAAAELLAMRGVRTVNFFTEAEQKQEGKQDVGMLGYEACAERLRTLMHQF